MKRALAVLLTLAACAKEQPAPPPAQRPSILLVTLDTTRADAVGGAETPAFNSVAARGRRFLQAYAAAPETLPSHSSMLTGLYAGGHGVHENARYLGAEFPLAAEKLRAAGYHTAAFVSAFPLARRFGIARGFEVYDDALPPGSAERTSRDTTDRALAWLRQPLDGPRFLWVHYYDPHTPYAPPEPYRSRFGAYRGEVAAMDAQLRRLLDAFDGAVIIAGDHGEALGEHGESQHGLLVYQAVMHVPLVIAGPGVTRGVEEEPVSTRRVFHTLLDWAGVDSANSLRASHREVVLGEGMIPFLDYGWQPQIMAVEGRQKVIQAGALEVYDVIGDPAETHDLAGRAELSREMRRALREYPVPSLAATAASPAIDEEARKQLASLGYVSSDVKPVVRRDAPRPRDMARLFPDLDRASALFAGGDYARAIPLLEKILAADPHNLTTALRLAVAHSSLGHDTAALAAFHRAESIAPDSSDVRHYLALHYARGKEWQRAVPLLEREVTESPDRLPALEALADVREKQNRLDEALALRQRIATMKTPTANEWLRTGELAMTVGNTAAAIDAYERARTLLGPRFANDLELGVLYLAARRFEEARAALDRVPQTHPAYAMALFKRAQVAVLLHEPDAAARIAAARAHADAGTRTLIERERLFQP
ncbi:MAG TPA: sulfatase-like hydrolase/transferase [Thermoanaerobaculia bacterium]|jgi:thioredoxin-like negative regulator of GroEL